jgi:sugar lactone lactonase YvrE
MMDGLLASAIPALYGWLQAIEKKFFFSGPILRAISLLGEDRAQIARHGELFEESRPGQVTDSRNEPILQKQEENPMKLNSILTATLALCISLTANAQLDGPSGLAFDSSGDLWVANSGANQVLELNATSGAVIKTITAGLNNPSRLTLALGQLYVTNLGANNVTVYNPKTGSLVRTITSSAISKPLALAVDAYGDVYIGNNSANNVIALNINNELVEILTQDNSGFAFTAPGALAIHGEDIYAGFGPGAGENAVISYNVGEFLTKDPQEIRVYTNSTNTGPTGIAFDPAGNVYISDFYSATWVKYSPAGTLLLTVSEGVGTPEGIALDKSENVYVSNSSLNNITVYNSSGTLIRTLD